MCMALSLNAQTTGQLANYTVNADGGVTDALYKYAIGSMKDANQKATGLDSKNIEGSPYMSNDFKATTVYFGDENLGNLYYRYNAYNEEVEIKQQNIDAEPIRSLSRDKKINLMVDGKKMAFKTFIDKNGNTKNGYLTLLKSGKFKLYKRLNTTFKEAKKAENTLVKSSPARFSQYTEYYIEIEGSNRIDHVELNNKKLLKLVGSEKEDSVKKFLKENNIKVKNENGLSKVIEFLNS